MDIRIRVYKIKLESENYKSKLVEAIRRHGNNFLCLVDLDEDENTGLVLDLEYMFYSIGTNLLVSDYLRPCLINITKIKEYNFPENNYIIDDNKEVPFYSSHKFQAKLIKIYNDIDVAFRMLEYIITVIKKDKDLFG